MECYTYLRNVTDPYLMGRRPMKDVLGNQIRDQFCCAWPFRVKAFALLSLPTAVSCAFLVTDFYGACFSAGRCRLHHKDDVSGTRPVRSAGLLSEASVEFTRLHCCARTRLERVGVRQLVRAYCTVRRVVWCGRHSIFLRQGVMEVESFHQRSVLCSAHQPSTASVSSMGY